MTDILGYIVKCDACPRQALVAEWPTDKRWLCPRCASEPQPFGVNSTFVPDLPKHYRTDSVGVSRRIDSERTLWDRCRCGAVVPDVDEHIAQAAPITANTILTEVSLAAIRSIPGIPAGPVIRSYPWGEPVPAEYLPEPDDDDPTWPIREVQG